MPPETTPTAKLEHGNEACTHSSMCTHNYATICKVVVMVKFLFRFLSTPVAFRFHLHCISVHFLLHLLSVAFTVHLLCVYVVHAFFLMLRLVNKQLMTMCDCNIQTDRVECVKTSHAVAQSTCNTAPSINNLI